MQKLNDIKIAKERTKLKGQSLKSGKLHQHIHLSRFLPRL